MSAQPSFSLHPLTDENVAEYADLLFSMFNAWYDRQCLCMDYYEC